MMARKTERKGTAAVSWIGSTLHRYEDRYRLLTKDIPLVGEAKRGELFAVFDGISSAAQGMRAAQAMADCLLFWFRDRDRFLPETESLARLLLEANLSIHNWGYEPGTNCPVGGCAGSVAWLREDRLTVLHAGDTAAMVLRQGHPPRLLTRSHEINGGLDRYFGLGNRLALEVESIPVEEEDLVLLMSDGVTKSFSPTEAAALIQEIADQTKDIGRAAEELVVRSRAKGSIDDITVLVVEVLNE